MGRSRLSGQARKVQRLRNEAAAGELVVQVEPGDLEPRLTSWMERPSVSDVTKARQASRNRDWTGPIDPRAPKQRSWTTESDNVGLVDSGDTVTTEAC